MTPRDDERPKMIFVNPRQGQKHDEGSAKENEDIMPGMLIEIDSTSVDQPRTNPIVKKHSTAGGRCRVLICKEQFLAGLGIGNVIPDGDVVPFLEALPGDTFMARVADDFDATPGAKLQSNGDGTFVAQSGGGIALVEVEDNIQWSDIDVSDLDTTDPRAQPLVRVKVL